VKKRNAKSTKRVTKSKAKKPIKKAKTAKVTRKSRRKAEVVKFEPRKPRPVSFEPEARILFWDIEASTLEAEWGRIFCIGYKFLGDKKPTIISCLDAPDYEDNPGSDRYVLEEFSKVYSAAHITVAHYGRKYDLPYVQTRLLFHGLPVLPPTPMCDTWRVARDNLKLKSNRLANIVDFLDVTQKTPLRPSVWRAAAAGHKPSLRYIEDHCLADIEALADTYIRLRPLMTRHPNVNIAALNLMGLDACPNCGAGAERLQRRGRYVSLARVCARFQCQSCGSWHQGPPRKPTAFAVEEAFEKRKTAA
jgi:DNA polymerase elongation subunit (family B)